MSDTVVTVPVQRQGFGVDVVTRLIISINIARVLTCDLHAADPDAV